MPSNHMQPSLKFENQTIQEITRNQSLKRHSDNFSVEQLCNNNKKQRQNSDQENQENIIKYVPTRREVDSLVIDNYLFQRVSSTTNKDGSIGWRCKEYRTKVKCQSTCRLSADGVLIRNPGPHNHKAVSDAALVFMKAKADAKKRCRSENNISVQKIFLQEMGKAIINSGIDLKPEDLSILPRFEANKRALQIQRKIGKRQSFYTKDTSSNSPLDVPISCKTEVHLNEHHKLPISPPESCHSKGSVSDQCQSIPTLSNDPHECIKQEASDSTETVKSEKVCVVKPVKRVVKNKGLDNIISGLWSQRSN